MLDEWMIYIVEVAAKTCRAIGCKESRKEKNQGNLRHSELLIPVRNVGGYENPSFS